MNERPETQPPETQRPETPPPETPPPETQMRAEARMQAHFRVAYPGFALDVGFTAPSRGVTALFGPSGCGKTTVLRCVAGLHRPDAGRFALNGDVWQDETRFLPPHRRPIGYVFQEAALFPHLSVRRNLLYGYSRAVKPGEKPAIGFDETVALLGVDRLLDRAPAKLSGGERQRVAVGRALLSQPALLLMDEPMAALDRAGKEEILPYLERLHAALNIPALYVTHDAAEMERLADHLVLLRGGRVEAAGPTADLLVDPSLSVARLPSAGAVLEAVCDGPPDADGLTTLRLAGGVRLLLPGNFGPAGSVRRLRVAAADVSLSLDAETRSSILNRPPARILSAEPVDSAEMLVAAALGENGDGPRLPVRLTRRSWAALGLAAGDRVYLQIKGAALAARSTAP